MKAIYDTATTLQTQSRVRLEANYNRTISDMDSPGDILYYKSPEDPAEHPMYVDASGRVVPVSPTTLQPMTNASGQLVDKNGVRLPADEFTGLYGHIDDVRIAVASTEYEITDEEGGEIYIAYDGEIIPNGPEGVPNTTLVNGVVWVIGANGQPHAPLSKVHPLRSYVKPVRAENVPVNKSGVAQPLVEDIYPEYFDINSIVKANRPSRRGVLVAWAADEFTSSPTLTGVSGYEGARHYTAREDAHYKYWASPLTSEAEGIPSGTNLATFDNTWTVTGATNRTVLTNQISADFPWTTSQTYFQKVMTLDPASGHEMNFSVLAQSSVVMTVDLIEWTDTQPAAPNFNSASRLPVRTVSKQQIIPAGVQTGVSVDFVPSANSRSHALRVTVRRLEAAGPPRVTLSDLSLRSIVYPIKGVGPRAVYDRPIIVNKIVIGVDYSIDQRGSASAYTNKPAETEVRVYVDRGDGWFVWQRIATNPEIDDDGKVVLYFNGTSWGDTEAYDTGTTIMGVQYVVHSMRGRDARVNIMEISARRTWDVSEFLSSYSVDSEAADSSFVLPFGTVNSNGGSVSLSNSDGRFNSGNRYLLDPTRSAAEGEEAFTDTPNPFYKMLNAPVTVTVDTATFEPGDSNRDYVRVATGHSEGPVETGTSMIAEIPFYDSSKLLDRTFPPRLFYHFDTMSIIQVLYMLLDSVGFTNVRFSDEDEHFSTYLKYFWVPKDGGSVWSLISEICKATQTVAFFDERDVLNFKSLKGLYESALAAQPAQVLASEDVAGVKANIKDISLADSLTVNKVNVTYRETSEPERTPSGITPMSVVWEPEGSLVLRAAPLVYSIDGKAPSAGGIGYLTLPSGTTKTWPFSGMVQIEGEFIKYDGKQYRYHDSGGAAKNAWVHNDDERKELDKQNEYKAYSNTYTGRLKISERGAEGTRIRSHTVNDLANFTKIRHGDLVSSSPGGLSMKNSKLRIEMSSGSGPAATTSVSKGSQEDFRPTHFGTKLDIKQGAHAGLVFGLSNPNDDGIFVELSTTEEAERGGRARNELHVFVRKNRVIKYFGTGVAVPVSTNKEYTLDVTVKNGTFNNVGTDLKKYYNVVLSYGSKGNNVKVLQGALNKFNEKVSVDGSFGTATRNAVRRLQKRKGLTQDGVVRIEEWKALEYGSFNPNIMSIQAIIDGTLVHYVEIPFADLPHGYNGGRYGVFARGRTTAEFEYLYAVNGNEDVEFDDSQFFDYVEGGYVSDQLESRWIYNTKNRQIRAGGKLYNRKVVNNQLALHDFGPYAHEVRDFEVEFADENPALSSFLYLSNERQAHLTDYTHSPFGAKFRIVNKARHDAILNGEDTITFGSEEAVDQKTMIYGTVLDIKDERSVTVSDKTSVDAKGAEELSLDMDWIQSKDSAHKLGSHIVEAMSQGVPSYEADIFGNASLRVGQIVSVYDPRLGIGDAENVETANRFFIHSIGHSNDGSHKTSVGIKEVIGARGMRNARLIDVYYKNNNSHNMNPNMEKYTKVGNVFVPSGYVHRSGVEIRHVAPLAGAYAGGGAMQVRALGSTPYNTSVQALPFPGGVGRMAHVFGNHFIVAVNITAVDAVAAGVYVEGWPTTGSMTKVLASKTEKFARGETKTIVLKGRFTSDSGIPELQVGVRMLSPTNLDQGAAAGKRILINNFHYASAQNEDSIYPMHGGSKLRKL